MVYFITNMSIIQGSKITASEVAEPLNDINTKKKEVDKSIIHYENF